MRVRELGWLVCMACSGSASTPDTVDPCTGVPAPEVLASEPQQGPTDVAVDDQFVYWASFRGDAIRRAPKLGGSPETIATAQSPQYIAVDSTDVYWLDGTGDVMRVAKEGGPVETIATGAGCGDSYPCGEALALDDQAVYWIEQGLPAMIMRRDKSGGSPVALGAVGRMSESLALDADHIYFGALVYDGMLHHAVQRMPKLGGVTETLTVFDRPLFAGIALDADAVYVARNDAIWRVAKDRSETAVMANVAAARRIATDSASMYATTSSTVERIALDGGGVTTIACGQRNARSLVIDDSRVYWNDESAETINAAAK